MKRTRAKRASSAVRAPQQTYTASPTPPLLETKLAPPTLRPNILYRPRLTARLDLVTERRVMLIVAPAGYGKTTLAAEWLGSLKLEARDLRLGDRAQASSLKPLVSSVAWLSLTAADNDPIRFWRYVAAALDQARPGLGTAPREALAAPEPAIRAALVALLNGAAHAAGDLTLLLDDYHRISADKVHRTLAFFVEHMPPQLHLVAISRGDPPLPLARWRARDDLMEIRAADLRFTGPETSALLNQQLGLNLAQELVAALFERTEGWVAGLRLAAHTLLASADQAEAIVHISGSQRDIRDYLEGEVLRHQPPAIRDFLLITSVADRLNAEVCDALRAVYDESSRTATEQHTNDAAPAMARVSSNDMLERIERAGLFLEPVDAERRWYRYHPLFAQLLRHRLHQEFPDLEPDLRRLADMQAHPADRQGDDDQPGPHPPQDAQTSDPVALDAPLSERERDVLHLLAGGLSNEEIAESLIISANTVKMHIRHIYDKLDVHNRVQAITQAQARAMM